MDCIRKVVKTQVVENIFIAAPPNGVKITRVSRTQLFPEAICRYVRPGILRRLDERSPKVTSKDTWPRRYQQLFMITELFFIT